MKMYRIPLPDDFLARLVLLVDKGALESIIDAFSSGRPTTLRVNTLKSSIEALEQCFKLHSIEYYRVGWNPVAFVIPKTPHRTLTELPEYNEGLFYVQSLSSMIPTLVLDPKPGERILDITAAPGSKTTQMAALMENEGEIVANDVSHTRRYRLEANLKAQGVTNTTVTKFAGQSLWKEYPQYFDKALVDVPCSMEGRFDIRDPTSHEDWSTKKIKVLVEKQRWILRSAVSATKPGGTIVYSTCTLAPEENEGVIDWILKKEKGTVTVETCTIKKLPSFTGLLAWKSRPYHASLVGTLRIWPTREMEGFFVAKLRKISSNVPGSNL